MEPNYEISRSFNITCRLSKTDSTTGNKADKQCHGSRKGDPAEDPSQLRSELEDISEQLLLLVKRINRTNSLNQVDEGLTFSDALANRDILHLKHGIYRNLAQAATVTQTRNSKSEVKFNSIVDVKEIQEVASRLAQEHRQLDARIQEANWRVELLE